MSFIKGSLVCCGCKKMLKYFWLYPDAKFDIVPDRNEYIWADNYHDNNGYHISVSCPKCKTKNMKKYSNDGELIGE